FEMVPGSWAGSWGARAKRARAHDTGALGAEAHGAGADAAGGGGAGAEGVGADGAGAHGGGVDAAGADVSDLLGQQYEMVGVQGGADALDPAHLAVAAADLVVVASIILNAVAAGVLGEVAGLVGGAQRASDRGERLIQHQDADARGHDEGLAFPVEAQVGDPVADGFGQREGVLRVLARQQYAELVASQARQDGVAVELVSDEPRDLPDEVVAGGVPARVVDDLELIQIQIQHGVDAGASILLLQSVCQLHLEVVPVSQAGEGVMGGLVLEPVGQDLLLAYVSA